MPRELNYELKPSHSEESLMTLKDWKELRKEVLNLQLAVKNYQSRLIFIHSKMVHLFDTFKNNLDIQENKHKKLELLVQEQWKSIQEDIKKGNKNQEAVIADKVQDWIEKNNKINKKYSHQLKDLCQSLTHQSEQVWGLADQIQEIKEEISSSKEM